LIIRLARIVSTH